MATNLLKDGFSVLGYDIRAGVLKKLKDLGIKVGSSPKIVADNTEVVMTCLPTIQSLHEVYSGKQGLNKSSRSDQIILETSTFPITEKERVRDAIFAVDKRMLDCPVSGNRMFDLTAFASENEADYKEIKDVIGGFVSRQFYSRYI